MTAKKSTKPLREAKKMEGFPPIHCIAGAEHRLKIAARVALAVMFFAPSFVRPASANVIYVTTLADKVSGTGGCSLKEAIYSSTLHDTLDGVHGLAIDYTDPDHFITTGCEIGSGNDTIFSLAGNDTVTLGSGADVVWADHDTINAGSGDDIIRETALNNNTINPGTGTVEQQIVKKGKASGRVHEVIHNILDKAYWSDL